MRCKDSIREIGESDMAQIRNKDLTFEELPVKEFPTIRELRRELNEHLKEAPCLVLCRLMPMTLCVSNFKI